jgi:hypothetical protein
MAGAKDLQPTIGDFLVRESERFSGFGSARLEREFEACVDAVIHKGERYFVTETAQGVLRLSIDHDFVDVIPCGCPR